MPIFNGGRIGSNNVPFTGTKSDDPNYSSVSLLLNGNGTNGSTTFTDSSPSQLVLESQNSTNAYISTAESVFGGSSLYFSGGAGGFLKSDANSGFWFGTEDFTIEAFVRRINHGNLYQAIASVSSDNAGAGNPVGYGWTLYLTTDFKFAGAIYSDNSSQNAGSVISPTVAQVGVWYHVALVRNGTSFVLYVDGESVSTSTLTSNFNVAPNPLTLLNIGTYGNRAYPNSFGGYIDDLRITKGVARYTSNFNPPTAQLPGGETGTFASGLWTGLEQCDAIRREIWPGFVPPIVTDGLVLHLDAGDSASYPGSGTTWTDLTGNGNNGTLVSMDGNNYSSANGGYLDFDGSSDYVQGTISSSTFTGPHSICCWFYRQTVKQWAALFSNNVNTTSCSILTFIDTSNSLGTNQSGINATSIAVDLGADHLNKWIYGVITFGGVSNGSAVNVYAYKDGSLLTNSGSLYWNMSSSSSYYVGRHWASAFQVHDGFISQVTIYNKALTQSEVTQNYNALKGRYGL